MEEMIKNALAHSPEMAALLVIVWMFLKHLKCRERSYTAAQSALYEESLEARKHSREVIEKNTEAVGHNNAALHEMTQVMQEFIHNHQNRK